MGHSQSFVIMIEIYLALQLSIISVKLCEDARVPRVFPEGMKK